MNQESTLQFETRLPVKWRLDFQSRDSTPSRQLITDSQFLLHPGVSTKNPSGTQEQLANPENTCVQPLGSTTHLSTTFGEGQLLPEGPPEHRVGLGETPVAASDLPMTHPEKREDASWFHPKSVSKLIRKYVHPACPPSCPCVRT